MIETAEDPVGQASSKIVQYVSLATMAAEALAQHAQQRASAAAATDQRATAALRAQQTGARTAARLQWQTVLDARRGPGASLADAGLAWAASHAWRDVDPEAALAGDRALERMRELRPDVMSRFDRLTSDGLDQVEAMRRVASFFDRPAAREHGSDERRELIEAKPVESPPTAADSTARVEGGEQGTAVGVDDHAPNVDKPPKASMPIALDRPEASEQPGRVAALPSADDRSARIVLVASGRSAPQLAHEAYPEPLTGQVLSAGKVKPKTPDRTAPAAVRSTGLATAARAARLSTGGRGR